MRVAAAASVASLLLVAGCTGNSPPHRSAVQTKDATATARCPVAADAATFRPAPLPPGLRVTGVQSCVVDLAARPGRGYWIRVSEKHAIAGADAYVEALRLPAGSRSGVAPSCPFITGMNSPLPAVVDAAGALRYPEPPLDGCGPNPKVKIALDRIRWSAVSVRWINQMLPEGSDPTCVPSWRTVEHGQQAPIAILGQQYMPHSFRSGVCAALPTQAPGPRPSDLIAARVVTDRSAAAPLLASLSREVGAGGCRPRAWAAYRVYVAARYVAFADLGPCPRMVSAVPTLPDGLADTLPSLANPWEQFYADEFTAFVPWDMYSSAYGLKIVRKWRGYVARQYRTNPCRGFVDVSKCQPARATAADPIALTFTDVPATASDRDSRNSPRRWRAGGLLYEQWYVVLPCGRLIGVTASMLAGQAAALSTEANDVVQSIAPTPRCR